MGSSMFPVAEEATQLKKGPPTVEESRVHYSVGDR